MTQSTKKNNILKAVLIFIQSSICLWFKYSFICS